jgi:hypothetical protein
MFIPSWKNILNKFSGKHLIVLGEVHGIKINIEVIRTFVDKFDIDTVFVELPVRWNKHLRSLKNGDSKPLYEGLKREAWVLNSGLIGQEHIELFKDLFSRGKEVVAVIHESKNWNEGELKTASNIKKRIRKRKKYLLVVGNLHARNNHFRYCANKERKTYTPIGYYLRGMGGYIRIRYGHAKATNFGLIKLIDEAAVKELGGRKNIVIPSRSRFYDYDFIVSSSGPVTVVKLTDR